MAEIRFIPWELPLLPAAADLLAGEVTQDRSLDLGETILVVPGARAGRRLMEILVVLAEEQGITVVPPHRILTVGALPEELYRGNVPLATGCVARRSWVKALEGVSPEAVREAFGSFAEDAGSSGGLALARVLDSLNRTTGGLGISFRDVAKECRSGFLFSDEGRWEALAILQERALRVMKDAGRMDREEARRLALRDDVIHTGKRIVLIGVVDLPLVVRRMLERITSNVLCIVHAGEEVGEGFDGLGTLRKEWWQDWSVPVSAEDLVLSDRPADQASEAVRFLAELNGAFSPEEITLGVPDVAVVPYLAQRLEAHGLRARYAEGTPLQNTPPFQLLQTVADHLSGGRFGALAALLRHPDLPSALSPLCAPELADAFFQAHLPDRVVPDDLPGPDDVSGEFRQLLEALHAPDLLGDFQGTKRLSQWAPKILDFLGQVYGEDLLNPARSHHRLVLQASLEIREAAQGLLSLPPALDDLCTPSEAIRILLGEARDMRISPLAEEEALEMVGWLELHLDDAPVMVLTGVNDPFLPEAVNADPFLPNALRARLGLQDNQGRYARDAYWLTAILHSTRKIRIIAGRRGASGDPLRPSRLLLTGTNSEVARRVLFLAGAEDSGGYSGRDHLPGIRPAQTSGFRLPPEPDLPFDGIPEPLPVTAFRSILLDPYVWALGHLLDLEEPSDEAQELDPRGFGVLAHSVLERFGRSAEASSSSSAAVLSQLDGILDGITREWFGPSPLPAVSLQVEQLRVRLKAFSEWQSERVAEGWRIHAVEARTPKMGIPFDVDGVPLRLSGRIDRIDRHEETGAWLIMDYKTGDSGGDPSKARTRDGRWEDLQLPLYRHLLAGGLLTSGDQAIDPPGPGAEVGLAYLPLSKEAGPIHHVEAPWSPGDLEEADHAAREVIRSLRETKVITFDPEKSGRFAGGGIASLLGQGLLRAGEGETGE